MNRDKLFQIGALALACFTAWVAFNLINAPPMTRGELADWAQGIGSIAAVGIAAWVGTLPIRQEARAQRRERHKFLDSVDDATRWIEYRRSAYIEAIAKEDQSEISLAIRVLGILKPELVLTKLLELPFDRWPNVSLLFRVQDLLNTFEHLQTTCLPLAYADDDWTDAEWGEILGVATNFDSDLQRLTALVRDLLDDTD